MSKDARGWRDEATAAMAGGKHKRALAAYLELERIEQRDAQWAKRAAEMYRKLGRDSDAIGAYSRSADRYAQNGFLVQAIAVYKLILQIDGNHSETLRRMAAMTDQVGASPTRVGEMAEHNVALHDDSRVMMLRQPRVTQIDGSGGFSLPSEEMYLDDLEPEPEPEPATSQQQTQQMQRTMQMPMPVARQAMAPAPQPQPQPQPQPRPAPQRQAPPPQEPPLQYAQTQPIPRDFRPPAAPQPQTQPPVAYAQPQAYPQPAPPPQVARTRSRPITLSAGAALDSVRMSDAVPESRIHSQAGIYMIPIDDEDLIPEAELDAAMEDEHAEEVDLEPDADEAYELPPVRDSSITIDNRADVPDTFDINLDTQPPKRHASAAAAAQADDVAIDISLSQVIELPPESMEEVSELDMEDVEEIPLGERKYIGSEALKALQATPLFAGLPSAALEALVSRLSVVTLQPGEVLFKEGDPGDSLYIVAEGEVVMESEGPPRAELGRFGEGAFLGEVALMTDQPRAATVSALDNTELLQIDRATLAAVLAEHGDVLRAVLRFVRDRLVDRWTRTSPLFRPFDDASRAELAGRFKFLEIEGGTTLLAAGKRPDGLYIVLAGQFQVQRADGSRVASLGPGELIGETALLSGGAFKSNVVAVGRALALCLPAGEFREIIMTHPHVLEYIGEQAEHARKLQIL